MNRPKRRRSFPDALFLAAVAVIAGLAALVVALPLTAQSPDPSDESVGPLVESEAHSTARALYDADGDGAIGVDEFLTAVRDHLDGRIDKATARRVMELHIGGSLAYAAASTDKDWARIACDHIGCPIYPTPTPKPSPVPGPPAVPTPPPPTPTHTPTHTPTPEVTPTNTPTRTPVPTPIPRLADPCGHYDFNGNGTVDQSEVNQAMADHSSGTLHRSDLLAVIGCYLAGPPATPTPTPTPADTPTAVPGDTPTPVSTTMPAPGITPTPPASAPPYHTPTPTPANPPVATPTPTNTPPPAQTLPGKPTGLILTRMIGDRGIRLTWKAVAGASDHEVIVSEPNTATFVDVDNLNHRADITGLTPGKLYTFKVIAKNVHGETASDDARRIAPVPKHWWGHQADHTVRYVIHAASSEIVKSAVVPSVRSWNSELGNLSSGLLFCSICDQENQDNSDGFDVRIKTVNNKNRSTQAPNHESGEGCGDGVACVKVPKFAASGGAVTSIGPGEHMEDMVIVLEDPPWSYQEIGGKGKEHVEWEWTNDETLHGILVPKSYPAKYFRYVKRAMMHELGHTLGLHDFYKDETMNHLVAVMNESMNIEDEDISQLQAIYLLHSRKPH